MKSMGEIIAKLRKDAGLTQEQLANMIGVSSQTVSKWETGTTMPDIMLLPIIADVFDVDIDSLYGIKRNARSKNVYKHNAHEVLYNSFFETLEYLWHNAETDAEIAENGKESSEYLKKHPDTQTLVLSNIDGNGVFADCNIALAFNKNKDEIQSLYDDDIAWTVLKRFADGETRAVFKYLLSDCYKSFTAPCISAKAGIELPLVECALDNLLHLKLISRTDVATEEGVIYVYRGGQTHKLVLVYSLLAIAYRLGNYKESYRGFIS